MSLILLDSSVWIDYYHPRGAEGLKLAVRKLIENDEVAVNGIIAAEVLQGTADELGYKKVHSDMTTFHELELGWKIYDRTAKLGFDLRRKGITIPLIDCLISATALEHNCSLWHQDNHYELIAQHSNMQTKNWLSV